MTSSRILILQTGEAVDAVARAGNRFVPLFTSAVKDAGVPVEVRALDVRGRAGTDAIPALSDIDGVIVTGSAGMVDEDAGYMRFSVRIIRQLLDEERPFLGVCFGHQLLGVCCGADVGPNPRGRQMGTVVVTREGAGARDDEPLLGGHPRSFSAQVTHRDVIRDPGPRLTVVASAPHDPVHAVRAGRVAWGVQFHPEFTVDTMRGYLDARASVYDGDKGPGAAARARETVTETKEARAVIASFVRLADQERQRRA